MRADRLLSLLMLLQTHGKLPAHQLAKELEVSERTIYRDIEALSMAGIPIYGEPGREGGFALVDHYRTTLTGLSDAQVQALFMLNIPAPLADLGVRQEARTALLKIAAALPGDHREDERRVRQRFFLDAVGWDRGEEAVPHLQTIHQAVWHDRQLWISYRIGPLAVDLEQRVEPYGLVAKAGIWYLVYRRGEALRVQRVSRLLDARLGRRDLRTAGRFRSCRVLAGLVRRAGKKSLLLRRHHASFADGSCLSCPVSLAIVCASASPRPVRPMPKDGSPWSWRSSRSRPPATAC